MHDASARVWPVEIEVPHSGLYRAVAAVVSGVYLSELLELERVGQSG